MANSLFPVLVYQLPFDLLAEALAIFPKEHIEKIEHEEVGLKIYFKKYSIARECILKRSIHIQGLHYTICPSITNLTLHGIRKYASISTIRNMMAFYGCVVNLYPVVEITKEGKFETKLLTDDYRVVLGVPEVQIDFTLSPLQLPDLRDRCFDISFFCRLCRQNGHMQIHCSEDFHCSITQKEEACQNEPRTERQRSYTGRGCCENSKEEVQGSSNTQKGLQVSEEKILVQIGKGEVSVQGGQLKCKANAKDSFGYSQAEIINAHTSDSFRKDKKYLQSESATQIHSQDTNVKDATEPSQNARQIHLHGDLASQTSFHTNQPNMTNEYGNCLQEENILCCKSKSCKTNNLPKSSDTDMWSRITPPNAQPGKTKRLIISILKEKRLNISPNVERKLLEILEWNHHGRKEYLEKNDRKLIKWLELYLAEVSHNRSQSGHLEGEQVYQPQNATGDEISGAETKKKRQGVLCLCPGIEEIVLKTKGVLDPEILRNFLNQVRGRKKQMEIAEIFEKDFVALSNQLNEVIKSYYFYGKRGTREDGDIDFIKKLKNKLMQESTAKEKQNYLSEQPSFNKEPVTNRIPSHYPKNQNNVNCYNQSKNQTSRVEMDSRAVESKKYSRKKYLPNRDQSSQIPKSAAFCPPKLSEETFQSKPQRPSISDGNCIKSSNTEKSRKNVRWINKNKAPAEIKSRQILDDSKSSSLNYNAGREFERNLSFDGSQCTPGLNYSIKTDSLGASALDIGKNKGKSNRRSSYSSRFSTSLVHHERKEFVDNPSTKSQNVRRQPTSAEEFPEMCKSDLLEILPCKRQSDSAAEVSKITKEHLQQILSNAHQSTKHS